MEKKKLLHLLPAGYKLPEQCIHTSQFQTTQGDPASTKTAKIYERCIIIFSNAGRVQPWGRIDFHFDLIFEVVRAPVRKEEEGTGVLGPMKGFKFEHGEEVCYLFSNDLPTLKLWRDAMSSRLNQRGFHELFKPIKKIGKGNFASVYLAIRLEDEKKFAIKAFSKEATYAEDKGKESLVNEIELMRRFNHKNLMKLFEVYESQNSIYVSVELLEGGQLYDKIKAKHKFSADEIQATIRGLLMGLEHMHERKVMHRDLKPENILLRKEGDFDCVIADFGLSTWADEPQYLFVRCGTPGYVAPQIVNLKDLKAKCDPICDIFSLGVIFHILLMGKSPFPGKTYNEVLAQNRACNINFDTEDCQKLPAVSTTISYSALSLLKSMLDRNPQTRITAKDALQHPFLNNHTDYSGNSMKEELTMPNTATSMKQPLNKTSIMVNGACNSPLMTSCNPLRKNPEMLKDDSCLKFKMKESILTGKTEEYESGAIDSPAMKKNMQLGNNHKESRFGQEKRLLAGRDMNAEN